MDEDDFAWKVTAWIGMIFMGVLLLVAFIVGVNSPSTEKSNYQAQCAKIKGITAWNGRNYECLREK